MSTQPGWHPDPAPQQPGQPPQLRWWDGTRWTEHTAPAQPEQQQHAQQQHVQQPAPPSDGTQPPAYTGSYGASYAASYGSSYGAPGQPMPYGPGTVAGPATTPDGERLAGWWQRVGAYVIDAVLLGIVTSIVALPWLREIVDAYRDWFDEVLRAAEAGSQSPVDATSLQREVAGPLAVVTLIGLAVSFVYQVGFLMWRQATPGKLALGLRVRLRERPGRMGLGTVAVRWLAQFGVGVVNLVPLVGGLVGLYSILDSLWPLWDSKKQALHDKAAKTNVVRTR